MNETAASLTVGGFFLIVILGVATIGLVGCPNYNVYTARKDGQAELAKAEFGKQVAVQTARAKWESADYEAKAEVRRAEGVRDANKIIGDGLKGNEQYLRYLYINNLASSHDQVIYVPTEAGLPILEAGKRVARAEPEGK